jgi:hypothetical protein
VPPPDPESVVFCRGKVRHPSYRLAQENLNRVKATHRRRNRERGALQIYECDVCAGFHLGNLVDERDGAPKCGRPKTPPPDPVYDPEEEAA